MARTMIDITPEFLQGEPQSRRSFGTYRTGYARRQAAIEQFEKKREAESPRGQARKLIGELMVALDTLQYRWRVRSDDVGLLRAFIAAGLPSEDNELENWTLQASAILAAAKNELKRQPLVNQVELLREQIVRVLCGSDFDDFAVENDEGIGAEIDSPLPEAVEDLPSRIAELEQLLVRARILRANERARQRAMLEHMQTVEVLEFNEAYAKLDPFNHLELCRLSWWAEDLDWAGVPGMRELARQLSRQAGKLEQIEIEMEDLAERLQFGYDRRIEAERKLIRGKMQGGRAGRRKGSGHRRGFDPDDRRLLRREVRRLCDA